MSTLGYTSGQIEHKQRRLDEINRAVLGLQAEALGMLDALRFTLAELPPSRRIAAQLASDVEAALKLEATDPAINTLAERLTKGLRQRSEWLSDLHRLRNALAHSQPLAEQELELLSELASLFDRGFAEDLYRLYGRR